MDTSHAKSMHHTWTLTVTGDALHPNQDGFQTQILCAMTGSFSDSELEN